MTNAELLDLSHRHPIVVFDGVCQLCNGFVQWIIRHQNGDAIRFATLQSDAGQSIADPTLDTVYLIDAGTVYMHSDVLIRLAPHLRSPYRIVRMLRIIPRPIRNLVYRWVAKNRYRIWGKRESCMIPSAEQRKLFL